MTILNNNQAFFDPVKLWDYIEAVACHQCFSERSSQEVPPDVLNEIIGMYAHEFTKSGKDFVSFFGKFFDYFEKNREVLAKEMSLGALSNVAVAFASFGMTNEEDVGSWEKLREGTVRNLNDQG